MSDPGADAGAPATPVEPGGHVLPPPDPSTLIVDPPAAAAAVVDPDESQDPTSPYVDTISHIAGLVVFTLVPIVGVLAFGWDWREIVLLYWLENIAIGLAMIVRILRSRPPGDATTALVGRFGIAFFFTIHYGLFTLVHGVFVFAIIGGAFTAFSQGPTTPGYSPVDPIDGVADLQWGGILLTWAIGGAAHVLFALVGPRPGTWGPKLMMSAYPRIFALHITILGGAFLIGFFGWPPIAAILLIVLHAVFDVFAWLSSRGAPLTGGRHNRWVSPANKAG